MSCQTHFIRGGGGEGGSSIWWEPFWWGERYFCNFSKLAWFIVLKQTALRLLKCEKWRTHTHTLMRHAHTPIRPRTYARTQTLTHTPARTYGHTHTHKNARAHKLMATSLYALPPADRQAARWFGADRQTARRAAVGTYLNRGRAKWAAWRSACMWRRRGWWRGCSRAAWPPGSRCVPRSRGSASSRRTRQRTAWSRLGNLRRPTDSELYDHPLLWRLRKCVICKLLIASFA